MVENILKVYIDSWPIIHPNKEITTKASGLLFDELYMLFVLFCQRGLDNWDKDDMSMFSASNHWMPQSYFAEMGGYQMVDFVGKYENLKTDWKYVSEKIGVSDELPFVGASSTAKDSFKTRESYQNLHYSRFYRNQEIINIVSKFYKNDIDTFNYKLEIQNTQEIRIHF